MTQEERTLREEYVDNKCKLFQRAEKARSTYTDAYLNMKNAHQQLLEIEDEMWTLAVNHVKNTEALHEPAPAWHPASEKPERTDEWFLALTKDNLPFLTHYIKGWLPQVHAWKYIDIPTAPL